MIEALDSSTDQRRAKAMDSLGVEGYHCNIVLETSSTLLTPGRDVATEMNAGWSDSLDGEGEESMETILEKARMMVAGLTDNKNTTKTKEKKRSSDYDTPGRSEQPSGKKKKVKFVTRHICAWSKITLS